MPAGLRSALSVAALIVTAAVIVAPAIALGPTTAAVAFASIVVAATRIGTAATPRTVATFGDGGCRNRAFIFDAFILDAFFCHLAHRIGRSGLLERLGNPPRVRIVGACRRWRGNGDDRHHTERRCTTAAAHPCPQLSHDIHSHVEQFHRRYTQRLRPERKLT
jgi:hypothetical protein